MTIGWRNIKLKQLSPSDWVDLFANGDFSKWIGTLNDRGALAIRTGKDIEWDPKAMKITNHRSLNKYVKPKVRRGWREYY